MFHFGTALLLWAPCLGDPSTNTLAPPVSYLWDCPRSRDQPSRGPAVALVPPLLNSVSDMSSGLKVVDWLLLSLKEERTFTFG